ncbi:VWA domain-containing protein [Tamlana sp. 2_MG-2023]|uniref:VWA domain-containing protein n=1 Tax=unclassified Tamlana TaxID=2614803 RepID=UPI0026E28437|nr:MULTISPECIES: VWA domain-containing protein [unclassified Tamlana]MDO6761396.1 VWA domain-containing protein [Tamlana sp. 2_MG-2023]MDO6791990.1 VWA domain-containing protein [Tamlana sp. 1_MG-2023]
MLEKLKHIDWEKFHFLRTDYLWFGVGAILILAIGFLFYKENYAWKKQIAKHLRPYVIQKGNSWKMILIRLSVIIMFAIGLVAFLGPTWSQLKAPAKKVTSQFAIALDMSQSMLTTDVSPNRLERAKFKIHDLLDANPKAATNLVLFSGSTHVAIPFTTDYKIIGDQLDGLQPRMMPQSGTEFSLLFKKLDTLFTANKAEGKILLITDDLENLSIEMVSSYLQQNNVKLYIYPFATQSGGTIPAHKQQSALDISKLNSLDQLDQVEVLEITLDNSDVEDLAKAISAHIVFEDKTDQQDENWEDQGYWLVFPLAFIFLFSFRKGWALNLIIIMLCFSSCSDEDKPKKEDFKFKDLWYTKEYQAQQEYNAKNYTKAAVAFKDPMHKGVAYYKAGDYLSAETAFKQDSTVSGLYNLGLTYAKLGRLDESEAIFEKVLEKDPSNTNAKSNLTHVKQAITEMEALKPEDIDVNDKPNAKNRQNKSPEDLSGGGQKATKKDMQKKRNEETAETGKRKAKELDELPDNFKSGKGELPKNILMRKVDDDPALFLSKKFRYQIKKGMVETKKTNNSW